MDAELQAFLRHIATSRDLAANTQAAYRNDLTLLQQFLRGQGLTTWAAEHRHLQAFVLHLYEREYSAATRARKIAAVRSFYHFLVEQGLVEEDPTRNLGTTRVGRPAPTVLGQAEIAALFRAVAEKTSPAGLRDHAILHLLYTTGMRITEALALDLDHLLLDEGRLVVRNRRHERSLPLDQAGIALLARYLREGRPQLQIRSSGAAAFLNHRGQRLSRQGFWLILKSYAHQIGLADLTPRVLRHSFAAHALQRDVPLHSVRSMLGHLSESSTQRYLEVAKRQE